MTVNYSCRHVFFFSSLACSRRAFCIRHARARGTFGVRVRGDGGHRRVEKQQRARVERSPSPSFSLSLSLLPRRVPPSAPRRERDEELGLEGPVYA